MAHLTVRRLVAAGVLAVVAAVVTVGLVVRQPLQFTARTTVFATHAFPSGASAFSIEPFVASFQAALRLPEVAKAVAAETGVPAGEIKAGVSSRRGTQSPVVSVTFTSDSPSAAAAVATEASRAALRHLASRDLDQALAQAERAQSALVSAHAELTDFQLGVGFADLEAEFATRRAELRSLVLEGAPEGVVQEASARLAQVSALHDRDQRLANRLARAEAAVGEADQVRLAAEVRLATVDSPAVVVREPTLPISRRPAAIRGAVGAAVVVAAVCYGLFALVDRRRAARRPRGQLPNVESAGVVDVTAGNGGEHGVDLRSSHDLRARVGR